MNIQQAFITPVYLLDEFEHYSNFLFVESLIYKKSLKLRKYCLSCKKDIVLDNSTFINNGEPIDFSIFKQIIKTIKPTRIILPDKLRDWKGTIDLATKYADKVRQICPEVQLIGVPQGQTIPEWLTCVDFLITECNIDIIGITMTLPPIIKLGKPIEVGPIAYDIDLQLFRYEWISLVVKFFGRSYDYFDYKPVHILGSLGPREVAKLKSLKIIHKLDIRWNDTGMPFQAGYQLIKLRDESNYKKISTPFLYKKWSGEQKKLTADNIAYLKKLI